MAGGLLNLVASGNQSLLIYGNPQKTYWSSTYKRITNFGLQNFRVDYVGLRQLSLTSPTSFTFKVPRYADLLLDNVLCINLPDIYSSFYIDSFGNPLSYEFRWIKNIGALIIQSIRFTIGGTLIQEMIGYDLLTHANRDLTGTHKIKWNQMVGNVVELYDPAMAYDRPNLYPNASYYASGAEPSIRGRQLRIPIPIWWGLTSQQAFPLICLQYNELQIEIILRPINELYQICDVANVDPDHRADIISPNMVISAYQLYNFIQTPPQDGYTAFPTSWNENIFISSTYGFLSVDEQNVFAMNSQKYLIREFHYSWFYNVSITDKLWLQNSTGLVLNWMFLLQRSDVKIRNEWSNFTNWPFDHLPINITPYSNTLWITGPLHLENRKEIAQTFGILLDGTYREESRPASLFEKDQQFLSCMGAGSVTLPGLYCYNFCLNTSPFQLQPSGVMNLTIYSKIEIELTTISPPLNPEASFSVICDAASGQQLGVNKTSMQLYTYNYNLLVLEERYNVLTFIGGNAALMNAR